MSGTIPQYPWKEGDPLFASALNGAFLPISGGTIGSTPFGATTLAFNPINQRNATGALFLNKVSGSALGDDPQIGSYLIMDHDGGANPNHVSIMTSVNGNTGAWVNFNGTYFKSNNSGANNGHVGFYNQSVRTGINPGGTRGISAWSGIFELRSQTGLPSSQDGIMQLMELDLIGNGVDDLDHSIGFGRTVVSIVIGQDNPSGTPFEVSNGISFFPYAAGPNAHFINILEAAVEFSGSVLNTRDAVQRSGANAIWLKDGHTIALDAAAHVTLSSDGNNLKFGRLPTNAINDAAAAAAGVPVDGLYRNGSVLMVRAV
jgi:hypothetical protein